MEALERELRADATQRKSADFLARCLKQAAASKDLASWAWLEQHDVGRRSLLRYVAAASELERAHDFDGAQRQFTLARERGAQPAAKLEAYFAAFLKRMEERRKRGADHSVMSLASTATPTPVAAPPPPSSHAQTLTRSQKDAARAPLQPVAAASAARSAVAHAHAPPAPTTTPVGAKRPLAHPSSAALQMQSQLQLQQAFAQAQQHAQHASLHSSTDSSPTPLGRNMLAGTGAPSPTVNTREAENLVLQMFNEPLQSNTTTASSPDTLGPVSPTPARPAQRLHTATAPLGSISLYQDPQLATPMMAHVNSSVAPFSAIAPGSLRPALRATASVLYEDPEFGGAGSQSVAPVMASTALRPRVPLAPATVERPALSTLPLGGGGGGSGVAGGAVGSGSSFAIFDDSAFADDADDNEPRAGTRAPLLQHSVAPPLGARVLVRHDDDSGADAGAGSGASASAGAGADDSDLMTERVRPFADVQAPQPRQPVPFAQRPPTMVDLNDPTALGESAMCVSSIDDDASASHAEPAVQEAGVADSAAYREQAFARDVSMLDTSAASSASANVPATPAAASLYMHAPVLMTPANVGDTSMTLSLASCNVFDAAERQRVAVMAGVVSEAEAHACGVDELRRRWELYVWQQLQHRTEHAALRGRAPPSNADEACTVGEILEEDAAAAFDESQLAFLAAELLRIVQSLHRAGFVHAALTPHHVMLTERDEVRVLCFRHAIDTRLYAPSMCFFGPPDSGMALPPQAFSHNPTSMKENAFLFKFELDLLSVARIVYQLMHGSDIRLTEVLEQGIRRIMPRQPVRAGWNAKVWNALFSELLNWSSLSDPLARAESAMIDGVLALLQTVIT